MTVNAYDVQVCLWRMLKLSSKTCVSVSIKHPYISSSLLFLFFLYICFPLVFWILIYSFPLLVCTCILVSVSFSIRNGRKYEEVREGESDDSGGDYKSKRPYSRVHSVRRRRAKEIMKEDDELNVVQDKNAVPSTNFSCDFVDKKALIEGSPKEIREVDVDFSQVDIAKDISSSASQSLKDNQNDEGSKQITCLEILKEEDEVNKVIQENEDDQRTVMDVEISDVERNKRLEILIARRRSRKLFSLQVRRSLMNMDRNEYSRGQFPSLIIPKISSSFSPSKIGSSFSPGPGSAPSVLIPMRNPFDLPYDPQEEKLDLTGDSFQQEFTSVSDRDKVFCRHESFNLGPSLPEDLFQDRKELSLIHDFGFRQRRSSTGYRYSKSRNESDRGFAPKMEQESYEVSESRSSPDSPDDDQIKEIIQVYDQKGNLIHNEEGDDEIELRENPEENFSSSSSSPSLSEEDQPIFKIDKEAVLKSLSSMRRNVLLGIENNEQIRENLSYANSALENASRLKEQYYADKAIQRHAPSYSIASDLQVEVSEISSLPQTIGENMSYQDEDVSTCDGEMEGDSSWDGEDFLAGSCRLSEVDDADARSILVNEVNEQDIINAGVSRFMKREDTSLSSCSNAEFSDDSDEILQDEDENQIQHCETIESNTDMEQLATESMETSQESEKIVEVSTVVEKHVNIESVGQVEDEQSSGEVSTSQAAMDSNNPGELFSVPNVVIGHVQNSKISPKSVLLPTFSLLRLDHDIDEEVPQPGAHTAEDPSPVDLQNSTSMTEQSRNPPRSDGDAEVPQEPSEPRNVSTIEADDMESVDEKLKFQENDKPSKEVASSSSEAQTASSISIKNSTALMEHLRDLPCFDGNAEASQESYEPTTASTIEADYTESSSGRMKTQEYDEQPKQVASSSSEILGIHADHEAPAQPRAETSSRSSVNTDQVSSEDFEAANPTACNKNTYHTENSFPSLSTEEDLSKHQGMFIEESAQNDSTKSSSYEDQKENSALCEETGHERQTNLIVSLDGKKDEDKV